MYTIRPVFALPLASIFSTRDAWHIRCCLMSLVDKGMHMDEVADISTMTPESRASDAILSGLALALDLQQLQTLHAPESQFG